MVAKDQSVFKKIRRVFVGKERKPTEPGIFHHLTIGAFLAWIGLGSDGISSSCYGPQEAFLALGGHHYLGILLALMTAVTVFVISTSYKQIIRLFPSGGGGYIVASKLLSPKLGMFSGCALLVDYVLTITVSIASGADAVFSFLPLEWHEFKLSATMAMMIILIVLNLRGIRESVKPLVPIFLLFIATHAIVIIYGILSNAGNIPSVIHQTRSEFGASVSQLGVLGVFVLLMRAYSMGGGTYTGIEAVSNGLPILRNPKVETGRRTMTLMAASLAFMAGGLIIGYLLLNVEPAQGKTLNAVLIGRVAAGFPLSKIFILGTLLSEALILLVAAQTGFLDGPRVLSNMAMDGWMPSRFAIISDRLVTQNGILLMGIASLILVYLSKGSVVFMLVLYSMNVFFTFSMSQLGMVRHWWLERRMEKTWKSKIIINGIGLLLTSSILTAFVILKFHEGGWLTILVTSSVIIFAFAVKRHYTKTHRAIKRIDFKIPIPSGKEARKSAVHSPDKAEDTAIILVNGFTNTGLHTLFTVQKLFKGTFKNFVFLQTGLVDTGRFKSSGEIENLKKNISGELKKYVELMQSYGYYAESSFSIGTDVVNEIEKLAEKMVRKYPRNMLFAGQVVFPKETFFSRLLHNYTAFAVQKRLYKKGIPVVILPIKL
jgi:amino acid transporter